MNLLFVIFLFPTLSILANESPDTVKYIDVPDFFEPFRKEGDTTYHSYQLSDNIIDAIYQNVIMYRVTKSVNEKQVELKEYINKENGSWYEIVYDEKGGIIMRGWLKETGITHTDPDTIMATSPEPPYLTGMYLYRYHETVKDGNWIIYNKQQPFKIKNVRFVNGIEQDSNR